MTRSETRPARNRHERPQTVTDLAELLRETVGTVLVRGAGTQLDWAGRVTDPDLVLDTSALTGLLTYAPADMTASVRAGTPLTTLQAQLAEHGQWLALDPPTAAAGATVGGLLAAGDAGPSRLAYGGLRDHVIGVTLVLADGTVARSGGHVIKNVAGYDLAKLMYGSLGTLAVVAKVVVRLHPRPAATSTVAGPADARAAAAVARALMGSPFETAAIEWLTGRLLVRTDGTAPAVAAAREGVRALAGGLGVDLAPVPDPDAVWAQHAAAVAGTDGDSVLRVSGLPGDLPVLADDVAELAAGLEARIVSSAALGLHTVALAAGTAAAHATALAAIRERAQTRGDAVLLRRRSPALDPLLDALGPPPSTAPLLRAIRHRFDPAARLGPTRFQPWF